MKHIKQPENIIELGNALESTALKMQIVYAGKGALYLCGQCCLAMVANTTLQEAIIAAGHVGATRGVDLMNGLRLLGIKCKWRRYYRTRVPDVCIIRLLTEDHVGGDYRNPKGSHWVVRYYNAVLNPAENGMTDWITYQPYLNSRARSLIEIL